MSLIAPPSELESPLEAQLRALLNKCRRSREKPILSLEELAVAIITVQSDLTLVDVQRHILTVFKYYNEASVEASIMRGYQASIIIADFNTTFANLLHRFDIPIESFCADIEYDSDEDELFVSPADAQFFLQKHLTSPEVLAKSRQKCFPFLKLPVEIRLQIYGHVVGLPKSGVAIRQSAKYSKVKEVVVRSKDFDSDLQISDWEEEAVPVGTRARWNNFEYRHRHDGTYKCPDLRHHLALLRVNREIFNEAMPVFYSANSFVCSDLIHLEDFLATLAPERREQLRHISFFYTKNTHMKAAKAFKMLGEIEKLKRLDIVIDEEDFAGLTKSKGERMFPDLLRLPGFHTLRSMRAVKTVQFHGKCDTIREALQSWVVDIQVKTSKAKKPKKSKAAQKAARIARVAQEIEKAEEEDKSTLDNVVPESSEDQAGKNDPPQTDEEPHPDLDNDQNPISDFRPALTARYYAPPTLQPTTPPMRASKGLLSPFKFNPSNSRSHLATHYQVMSPTARRNNITTSIFDETLMASGSPTSHPSFHGAEHEQHELLHHDMSAVKRTYAQGYRPVPDIAMRQLLRGPGQMFAWKPVKPEDRDAEMWADTAVVSTNTSGNESGEKATAPFLEDPFFQRTPLEVEDFLVDHNSYELLQ